MKPRNRMLFVEGGGDHNPALASECRKAFSRLFEQAGVTRKPRVIVCGGRQNAYDQFCDALEERTADVWLLVDAEDLVQPGPPFDPWAHVHARVGDRWIRPPGADDAHLHLMAVCMEAWLLADRRALRLVFGPRLDEACLPSEGSTLETMTKARIYHALKAATHSAGAGEYGKGKHSFGVLAQVAPDRLMSLTWAARLLDALR